MGAAVKERKREPLTAIFAFFIILGLLFTFTSFVWARDVHIRDDGVEWKIHTYSHRVEDVLRDAGLTLHQVDRVYPSPETTLPRVGAIEITRAYPVFIQVDGHELDYWLTGGTVAGVLGEKGIVLRNEDVVTPDPDTPTEPYMRIEVTRIFKHTITEKVVLSHREVRQPNPSMDRGLTRLVKRGHDGLREDTVQVTYADGRKVEKELLESQILRNRQDRIVQEGTNTLLAARGGLTLRFNRAMYVTATAYCPGTAEAGCPINELGHSRCTGSNNNGLTSLGIPAIAGTGSADNPHIIAVDPRVIPYRTTVYIQGYGFARALDTGGSIKGNRIDLLFSTHEAARRFGRRQLKIYLLP